MKKILFKHAAIYTLSNFSVALVPFLLLPVLTRVLSPQDYGIVAVFAVMLSAFTVLVSLNLHGAVSVRFFDTRGFQIQRYVSTCLWLVVLAAVVLCLAVSLFPAWLEKISSLPAPWILLASLVAALQVMMLLLLAVLQASRHPMVYGALRFTQALLEAMLSILLVIALAWSWQGRLWAIAASAGLMGLFAIAMLVRKKWLSASFDQQAAKDALWYGLPLLPHALGGLMLGMADRLMVAHHLDLTRAGIYFVAVQIGLVIGIAADAFNRAFAPWLMESLSKKDPERDMRIVRWSYAYFLIIAVLAVLAGWLLPWIFSILIGPRYLDAASIARYMLLGNAFTGMYYMVANYVFYTGHTGKLSVLSVSIGLASLALMSYLLQTRGLQGAAMAFMLGQAALFISTWLLSAYCHKMPWLFWHHKAV